MYDVKTGEYSRWSANATAVDKEFWVTYGELLYVSTAVMTTAGYGDAFPTSTMARFCTCLHMMCSVFYVTVVMSVGLSKRSALPLALEPALHGSDVASGTPRRNREDAASVMEALHTDSRLRDRALSVFHEKASETEHGRARGRSLGRPVATLTVLSDLGTASPAGTQPP